MQDVTGEPVDESWSDERIAFRAHNTPTDRKAQYVISLLKQMRGDWDADRARLVARIEELSEAVDVLKLVYRKHIANDPSIGWDELGEKVLDALSNTMGVEELVKWQEAMSNE